MICGLARSASETLLRSRSSLAGSVLKKKPERIRAMNKTLSSCGAFPAFLARLAMMHASIC